MLVRSHPYVDQGTLRYYERHKKQFNLVLRTVSNKLMEDIIGLLLLPPSSNARSSSAKRNRKNRIIPHPSFLWIVSDIVKGDIAKQTSDRECVIKGALERNGLSANESSILHVSGLWTLCRDATTDPTKLERHRRSIVLCNDLFLPTFVLALHQKERVLAQFQEYVVCYCFSGSSVRGTRTSGSDLDVFCVIDDTDVKKMALTELKDKLRSIILGMGYELSREFAIPLNLNAQVYVLTDFWEALRDSNPIIYTMVRDGVPLYDKGIFVAWRRLLSTGRIRCSAEGTNAFARGGDNAFNVAGDKVSSAATEDLYYSLLWYAQAILACKGFAPTAPFETLNEFRKNFLKPPYNFNREAFAALSKVIRIRKEIEHGRRKRMKPGQVAAIYDEVEHAKPHFLRLFKLVENESTKLKAVAAHEYFSARLNAAIEKLAKRHPSLTLSEASSFVHAMPTPRGIPKKALSYLLRNNRAKSPINAEKLEAISRQIIYVGEVVNQAVDALVGESSDLLDLGSKGGKWLLATNGDTIMAFPLKWSRSATPLRAQHPSGESNSVQFSKGDARELLVRQLQYIGDVAGKERSYDMDVIRTALSSALRKDK
jgi:predicted nucleotidyltransferase